MSNYKKPYQYNFQSRNNSYNPRHNHQPLTTNNAVLKQSVIFKGDLPLPNLSEPLKLASVRIKTDINDRAMYPYINYFVDGKIIHISPELDETPQQYFTRATFIIERIGNNKYTFEELLKYSRIHRDKIYYNLLYSDDIEAEYTIILELVTPLLK